MNDCLCGHPYADHQQTPDGAAESDLCGEDECPAYIAEPDSCRCMPIPEFANACAFDRETCWRWFE